MKSWYIDTHSKRWAMLVLTEMPFWVDIALRLHLLSEEQAALRQRVIIVDLTEWQYERLFKDTKYAGRQK